MVLKFLIQLLHRKDRGYVHLVIGYFFYLFLFQSCNRVDSTTEEPLFQLLDNKALGVDFENNLIHDNESNVYLYKGFYNGAGVGLGDLNGDGLLDIFFSGNQVNNKFYLNRGDFKFEEVTHISGLISADVWSTGVSIIDVNGDGKLDIYVCKAGKPEGENRHNELFINKGNNREGIPLFVESAAEYGIDDIGLSVHAAFFDMDKDGDLDMYLLNNSIYPSEIILDSGNELRRKRDRSGSNKLYRNDGTGFTDVSEQAGIYGSVIGYGLGVSIGDVNRDAWPDIYIANDFFERDYLYINNGDGTFDEQLVQAIPEISQGAMGVDISDMNHDGFPDIYVTEMLPKDEGRLKTKVVFDSWDTYRLKVGNGYHRQFPRNTFQINNLSTSAAMDQITFSEVSRAAGVDATDWSWGVLLADFDNNGNKEIFVTNGIYKDLTDGDYVNFYSNSEHIKKTFREKGDVITELVDLMPSVPIPNGMFRKQDGYGYQDVAQGWGVGQSGFSNGSAYGDLDNDGDLDLVVSNINMPPFIYRNNSNDMQNHFLQIDLRMDARNPFAVGSQVTLWSGGRQFFQELYPQRGSMSTVDNRLHFGLGKNVKVDSLELLWPDGEKQMMSNIKVDTTISFLKTDAYKVNSIQPVPRETFDTNLIDVTPQMKLAHTHRENNYSDFNNDNLIYQMISNEGPKLAIGDVNKDGNQDFYVGGAKGFEGKLFLGTTEGDFKELQTDVFIADKQSEDTDATFLDFDNDGDLDLIVASGGYEFSSASFALADRAYLNDGKGNFKKSSALPKILGSTSCLAVGDYDNDGDADIFVGGRVVPSTYGLPADSYILENDGKGNFEQVAADRTTGLRQLGMITDALWSDYDRDGDLDLFLCGEWMPVTCFENDGGSLKNVTQELGLETAHGFWNTLETEDLDQDGYPDLVVGNLGLNSQFRASPKEPVSLRINDFDANGKIDHIVSVFKNNEEYPIATKPELTAQMPYLLKRYLKYNSYKEKTVADIFTEEQLTKALSLKVNTTASKVLFNQKGNGFDMIDLPMEAQLSPIYSIFFHDIDNDGKKEIITGGNQFRVKPQFGIYASSYGNVIEVNNDRSMSISPTSQTGFFVKGEVRDMEAIDISGKKYLIIARNNNTLKFFKQTEK